MLDRACFLAFFFAMACLISAAYGAMELLTGHCGRNWLQLATARCTVYVVKNQNQLYLMK